MSSDDWEDEYHFRLAHEDPFDAESACEEDDACGEEEEREEGEEGEDLDEDGAERVLCFQAVGGGLPRVLRFPVSWVLLYAPRKNKCRGLVYSYVISQDTATRLTVRLAATAFAPGMRLDDIPAQPLGELILRQKSFGYVHSRATSVAETHRSVRLLRDWIDEKSSVTMILFSSVKVFQEERGAP